MPRILYLVHNLTDPSVARRVEMFSMGGAEVEVAGFRRADSPPAEQSVIRMLELDVTYDARMLHRLFATVRASTSAHAWGQSFSRPDVIVARNLEMLAIANRLQSLWVPMPAVVYECLDIHGLLLREDGIGGALRQVEQRLMRQAGLLITSSPAFVAHHFNARPAPPVVLVENKVFAPGLDRPGDNPALRGELAPWRIGWFGALRCEKSLQALAGLAQAMAGKVEVTLRGRPARTEFSDFDRTVSQAQHLGFSGAYRYPDDLASIYSDVHFAWAIDFFQSGQNSDWLLPNRIYEGCLNGAIPIALAGTETAAFVERLGIGIVVPDVEVQTLVDLFSSLTEDHVVALASRVASLDRNVFQCSADECRALVSRLAAMGGISVQGVAA